MPEKRMLDVPLLGVTIQLPLEVKTPEETREHLYRPDNDNFTENLIEKKIRDMQNPHWGYQGLIENALVDLSSQIDMDRLNKNSELNKDILCIEECSDNLRKLLEKQEVLYQAIKLLRSLESPCKTLN